ncbi:MAG: type IV secretion system DNA-binding domain-containing protein [Dehalococcoidia bacterium]
MPRRRPESLHLAEVIPPRALESGIRAARAMVAALADESLSFEIAVNTDGPRWYVRARSETGLERALSQLHGAYPQAAVAHLAPHRADLDPALALSGERAVAVELLPSREAALPLRTDWRNEHDPLSGVIAAVTPVEGERVIYRLALGPAPGGAADAVRRRIAPDRRRGTDDRRQAAPSALPLVAALALGAAGLQGWRWYEAEEWLRLASAGTAALVGVPLLSALAMRLLRRPELLPPSVVDQKLAAPLFSARLDVIAVGDRGTSVGRLESLAGRAAAAYRAYDDPEGGGLRGGGPRPLRPVSRGRLPLLLNAAELAALWHLPDQTDGPGGVRRTTAKWAPRAPGHATRGVRVGVSDGERAAPVRMPARLLHRNQLIVAKTRRGKSTLLRHLAAGVMESVATGADDTALVVVDPHQDLAEAVLDAVPDELADRTVYLDFANLERPIGLNLIDVALFPDRDRTTEHIVTMMNRLWPANWGPRMEGALRAALSALLEANSQLPREVQFTLLDVAPFLTDRELRADVLAKVQDPALRAWFRDNYDRAGRVLQQQTANPVTSKIGRFTVTEASRLVLGQARSTFDPRSIIRDGGVLVVNTAVGGLGEGAASLVGATLLNLIGLLVEEQVALALGRRRRLVGLVDESSTLGAVDYPRMLSELGKYGASFVLVTQSLSKLDAIDRNLAPTIFANSDGLTVFQVSAEDARKLTPELGGDLEVEDLVSLDDFTCYARWWDGRGRPPAFSFSVDPPPITTPGRAAAIARRSAFRFGRPRDEVVEEIMGTLAERSPETGSGGRSQKSAAELADETAEPAKETSGAGTPGVHQDADGDEPVDAPEPDGGKSGTGKRAARNRGNRQRTTTT